MIPCKRLLAIMGAAATFVACGDTDVYGNAIKTYTENGNQITYRFWVSGDMAEVATKAKTSTAMQTTSDGFETRCRTSFASNVGRIVTTPWTGVMIILR